LDETKASRPDISQSFQNTEEEMEPDQRVATPSGVRPTPGPCWPVVWALWSTSDAVPSPIKTPQWEKPKDLITFLEYITIRHRCRPKDCEGPEDLPGTLPERGIATEGLLHRHAFLRLNE
jgi:hypothetical protein